MSTQKPKEEYLWFYFYKTIALTNIFFFCILLQFYIWRFYEKNIFSHYFSFCSCIKFIFYNFKDLSDDGIVLTVGQFDVTVADLKLYMSGYHSIKKWDQYGIELILNKMIFNLLYMNACLDEKLFITDIEMDYYTNHFFKERSINSQDFNAIEIFFSQNEPYSSFEDFFIKSSFYLNKIKYLAYKGYLKKVKSKILILRLLLNI